MNTHPLINAYRTFVSNRSNHKVGIIGQPDAGKSSLIHRLVASSGVYTSVETDATLLLSEYQFNDYGVIVDFPGIGTEAFTAAKYKKLIQASGINHFIYIFSSKIKKSDIEIIKYLVKEHKEISFIFNKSDALVDIKQQDSTNQLKRDKNIELKVLLKPYVKKNLYYTYISTLTGEGVEQVEQQLTEIFQVQRADYERKYYDHAMIESYLNYKTNMVMPKLFTPSFKNIVVKKSYQSLERTIISHFRVEEDDIMEYTKQWPSIQNYLDKFEQDAVRNAAYPNKLKEFGKIIILFRNAYKVKSINPVTMAFSSLFEAGMTNVFPVFQAIINYISEIKEIARKVISSSSPL